MCYAGTLKYWRAFSLGSFGVEHFGAIFGVFIGFFIPQKANSRIDIRSDMTVLSLQLYH